MYFARANSAIDSLSTSIIKHRINILLQLLFGKDFIYRVTEILPSDVSAFFGSLEIIKQELKLILRKHDFGHVKTDSELSISDESRSQLVKVSKELSNSDPLLLANLSNPCQYVLNIIRDVLHNFFFNRSGLGSWEKHVRVVVVSSHSEHIFRSIYFIAEIHIIDLIHITLIHVSSHEQIHDDFRSNYAQLCQNSGELHLGHMAVFGDIKILEQRFKINPLVVDCLSVLIDDITDLGLFFFSDIQVLSSC